MRVGIGYDVHKMVEGRSLVLGGVNIPYQKACWAILTRTCWYTPL
jgi:2C-methyl-D-erythritol 2,4-cyclodiphosphate synthase